MTFYKTSLKNEDLLFAIVNVGEQVVVVVVVLVVIVVTAAAAAAVAVYPAVTRREEGISCSPEANRSIGDQRRDRRLFSTSPPSIVSAKWRRRQREKVKKGNYQSCPTK